MKIFVYPGSFDPITNGHLDIIERGASLCDKLIVAVLQNSAKKSSTTKDQRVDMIQKCVNHIPNVEVKTFDGLTVDFAKQNGATTILRGLRAVTDFEYELQMAFLNRQMNEQIDTCFLMASQRYSFLSSSLIRDIASYHGKIDDFVPKCIIEDVYRIYDKTGGNI